MDLDSWRCGLSKREKLLQSMQNNPKNVKFDTIRNVLLTYGFKETTPSGGSSHFTYSKGQYRVTVVKDKPVNSIYIKKALRIIELSEEES